jgi:hypothetical protein
LVTRLLPFIAIILILTGCAIAGVPLRPDELQWWWANEAPPVIQLSGPTSPVRSRTLIQANLTPADRATIVSARLDGLEISANSQIEVDTATMVDGSHTISVLAEDRSRRRNRSEATISFQTDNTPPVLSLDVRPVAASQGSTATVRLRANEPTAVDATLDGKTLSLTVGNGYAWAILSFGPDASIGVRNIQVMGKDQAGNESRAQVLIPVNATQFVAEDVQIPPALASLLTPEYRRDEEAGLAALYARDTGPARWNGRFRVPVEGPIVTEFGTQRAYNGGPMVGYHAGLDIAAPMGTFVRASQSGRVALIDKLPVRGNTVVIDHGHGVYTTYAHLQEVLVQSDMGVEVGQRIARVGTTGLSTGPHLHWEVWVNGSNVEPMTWSRIDPP